MTKKTIVSIENGELSFPCAFLYIDERRAKSQVYTLMLGSRNIPMYCHMGDFGCGGGGWTLVMKTDGAKVKEGNLLFSFQKMLSFYFVVNFYNVLELYFLAFAFSLCRGHSPKCQLIVRTYR